MDTKNKEVEKMLTSQKVQVSVDQRNLTQYVASHVATVICPSLCSAFNLQYKSWPIYYQHDEYLEYVTQGTISNGCLKMLILVKYSRVF